MNPLSKQIGYKPLSRIAPSHFYAMVQCPYKLVLSTAFDNRPLVPLSPNAYIGSVFHILMENIVKGKIQEDTFESAWDEAIKNKEDELRKAGITFCLPLKSHVQNIGLKKILLKNHLRPKSSASISANIEFQSEKWLQDKIGTVGGKIDLIAKKQGKISISDFKTGKLTYEMIDEGGEITTCVKEEYEYQLKLYAQLYFLNYNVYPDNLCLIDINKNSIEIPFTHDECQCLYEKALTLLSEINDKISKRDFHSLANCSIPNCRYCLYRPACDFYLSWVPLNPFTSDVYGTLVSMKKFLNGNINLTILVNDFSVIVAGVNGLFEEFLSDNIGNTIGIFGLKKNNANGYNMNSYSCVSTAGSFNVYTYNAK